MKAAQALEIFLNLNATAFKAGVKAAGKTVDSIGTATKDSMRVANTAWKVGRKGVDVYRTRLKALNTTAGGVHSTLGRLAALVGGGLIFGKGAQMAVSFNSTVEQSQIGLAALVRTFNQVPEGADKYARSMDVAGQIQRNLQIEGLKTVATYEQLLVALQEGIGPAFKRGFDPQQVVDFTSQMTQAAAALSLPMDQLGQEIRSILDGTIDRNSRVAKSLGITNEKVKEMAASGQLFDYLSDKLNDFALAGEDAARTWTGAFSNLMDAVQMALGKGFTASFAAAKQLFLDLRDVIVTIDEAAGTFTFNEKITAALDVADGAITAFIEGISKADMQHYLEILGNTISAVITTVVTFLDVMRGLFDVMGPALPLLAGATTALLLFGGAFEVLIGMPLMLAKHVMALNDTFVVLTGNNISGWATKAVGGFTKLREGLTFTKIAAGGLKSIMGSLAGIFAAWQVGFEIGTFLNKFDIVKKAALGIIHTLDLGRLKAKQFWAWLSGGDTEGVQREIDAAKSAYSSLITEIEEGKNKGVNAHKKIADAAALSAKAQVKSQLGALNTMGEAYGEYADKVKKLMPGDDGYEGSEAYQSWKAIEGAGLTLDDPEEGMTKDELDEYNKQKDDQKEKEQKQNQISDDKHNNLTIESEKRLEEQATARDRLDAAKKQQEIDAKGRDQELKFLNEKAAIEGNQKPTPQSNRDVSTDKYKTSNDDLNKYKNNSVQTPVIATPDPVSIKEKEIDAAPAIDNVLKGYTDRKQLTMASIPWSVGENNTVSKNGQGLVAAENPELTKLFSTPLADMQQQASDAIAAVPASLSAMTSSSVQSVVRKLQTSGSQSTSSGSRAGVAANVPKKIVELRFAGGSLQGSERDANALISHLEKAGLTA